MKSYFVLYAFTILSLTNSCMQNSQSVDSQIPAASNHYDFTGNLEIARHRLDSLNKIYTGKIIHMDSIDLTDQDGNLKFYSPVHLANEDLTEQRETIKSVNDPILVLHIDSLSQTLKIKVKNGQVGYLNYLFFKKFEDIVRKGKKIDVK